MLAQFLVVVPAQRRHNGVRQKVPVALKVSGVETRRYDQVEKNLVKRFEMISMHLTDDSSRFLVVLGPNRGSPWIERRRDVFVGQPTCATLADHQRGQSVQAMLAVRIVHGTGLKGHSQRNQRRVQRLLANSQWRGGNRPIVTTSNGRSTGQDHRHERRSKRTHYGRSSVSTTTVRLASAK